MAVDHHQLGGARGGESVNGGVDLLGGQAQSLLIEDAVAHHPAVVVEDPGDALHVSHDAYLHESSSTPTL